MPNTSQIAPTVVSCFGGLVLNKDIFSMRPGEALQLQNFEPDIAGGYKKILGTTAYNSNIVPQVSSASEIVDMVAIFNDVVLAARGGTVSYAGTSGSWTSITTGKSTSFRYDFERYNYNGTEKIMIAKKEYEEGLDRLRTDLVTKQEYMRDDRVNLRYYGKGVM